MSKGWNDLAEVENVSTLKQNLLLIDGNNLAYRWLRRNNHGTFSEDYDRTISSLANSYNAIRVIVCFDFGKSYYRMELLDSYKGTREKPTDPEEVERYENFFGCLNTLPDNISQESYKYRGVEADDLITFFAQNLADEYEHTWIVSSDKDIYQLVEDDVSIFNIYSRKEITVDSLVEQFDLTPDEYRLARIISGDKSDNIIGIEGIGDKRSMDLAREYKTLDNLISALPINKSSKFIQNLNNGIDTLRHNEQLVSLKDYHEAAIRAGKMGDEAWEELGQVARNT